MAKRLCQETLKQSRFLFVCFYDKSNPDFILCTSSKPGPLTKHSKPATYNIISQSRRTIIGHPFSLSTCLHHLNDGQLSVLHKQYKKYCFFPEKWQQCFSKVSTLTLWMHTTEGQQTKPKLYLCYSSVNALWTVINPNMKKLRCNARNSRQISHNYLKFAATT